MPSALRQALARAFIRVELVFDKAFGPRWNPFHQLGALAFFFYWIVAITGIYLFILFETSVAGAYDSVERLTIEQWYVGGVMRSLHRYASDAMVVTGLLHLVREFVLDRYRGMRWFAWFTGVPILWLLYASGITGYWLVWDKLAQYVAVVTSEWLDWFPVFGEPIARNFLTTGSLGDRFFTLLIFLHIGVPLFLLFTMWIHLLRLSRPAVNPPRGLAAGALVTLVVLSLLKPALSQGPADLSKVAADVGLDWFYLLLYPLLDVWPPGPVWALVIGASLLLSILPWLPPQRRPPVAVVDLENCNGCGRCFADCPFGAVTMVPRTDGRPYPTMAKVDPGICLSCGICVGSCPTATPFRKAADLVTGIDLPELPLGRLREESQAAMEGLADAPKVLLYGCDHGIDVASLRDDGVAAVSLPCIAMLPPSFIDYALSRGGMDGVLITGCAEGECHYRFGTDWTDERLAGKRDPYLRERVPRQRVRTCWAAPTERGKLTAALAAFRRDLAALPPAAFSEDAGPPAPPSSGRLAETAEDARRG